MNVDFLNHELGTTAYTNVVSSDGYDVTNLLLKQVRRKTPLPKIEMTFLGSKEDAVNCQDNGFMADYFVKPPVDIVFQFPCLLDITKIVVNRRSGCKRVAEFVIYSANAKPQFNHALEKSQKCVEPSTFKKQTISPSNNPGNAVLQDFQCKYEPDFSQAEVRKQNRFSLHTIGRFSSRTTDADIIIFNNPRGQCIENDNYERQSTHAMPLFSLHFLYGVSHLIIRVLRTEESTVAAIKRLEAWGRPSNQNKGTLNARIYSLIRQHKNKCMQELNFGKCSPTIGSIQMDLSKEQQSEEITTNPQDKSQDYCSNKPGFPEDFIDPITCEMMMLPVLLPSGLTIDSATLEKCAKEDERNGRMPLDPFTGIPLRGESKPVPNTSLKLRIDNFLLQNKFDINQSNHFTYTSGVSSLSAGVVKRVVNNKRKQMAEMAGERDTRIARTSNLVSSALLLSESDALVSSGKTKNTANSTERYESMRYKKPKRTGRGTTTPEGQIHISNDVVRNFENSTEESHEATLQNSLEAALKQVNSSVLKHKKQESYLTEFICSTCKRHGREVNLFKLPCHHLNCRKCIQEMSTIKKCTICSTCFSNKDVVRVHFSEYFDS